MTPSQQQALEDIERHGNPWARVVGAARHGGWNGVVSVIRRNKWAESTLGGWVLTDAGKAALGKARRR